MDRIEPEPLSWLHRTRDLFYMGRRFECPFCRGRFRRLRPGGKNNPTNQGLRIVGAGRRRNRKCPRCRSTDRERLVLLDLQWGTDVLNDPDARKRKLLHVAPERRLGRLIERETHLDYLSVDLDASCAMVEADVTNLQYPDDHFDTIICNHVLEHVANDRKAMAEIYRVLRPGGLAILQVPVSIALDAIHEDAAIVTPESRESAFRQRDHVRIYTPSGYRFRLEQVGFRVEEFDWTRDEHFGGPTNRYALNEEERVYAVRKSRETESRV